MNIEITRVNFLNKGAELMLQAIVAKLRVRYPQAKIVLKAGYDDYFERAVLGLYQKIYFRKFGIAWDRWLSFLPKRIFHKFGFVLDDEIDVIIDAAGFSYSDQWGIKKTRDNAFDLKNWKKQGAKIIMMPQAFGPFSLKGMAKSVKKMVEYSDLIYARESTSYKYLTDIVGALDKIQVCPDFTILLEGRVPSNFSPQNNKICFVPNKRMIDKTSDGVSHHYTNFLAICLRKVYHAGLKPFFLIHEGQDDYDLAKMIMKKSGIETEILVESNPIHIKGIISLCDAMIGSRFHGLVSALSQGIPAIAIGWSHKYEMLLDDYGFKDGLLKVTDNEEKIEIVLNNIIDVGKRRTLSKQLLEKSNQQKFLVESMWDKIFSLVDEKYEW